MVRTKLWFKIRWSIFSTGTKAIEKDIAERGGGWDGLELGKWYRVFVVMAPREGELTPEGKPMNPICRRKDRSGNLIGRYIVMNVDEPVKLGQELIVLVTSVGPKVVFATETDEGAPVTLLRD
jgi:hypothetical protein